MAAGSILESDADIKAMLEETRTIAILGISSNGERDSHRVATYLADNGYSIIPVRPGSGEILGQTIINGLSEVSTDVDIIDVFRQSDQVLAHVPEMIALKPKAVWMQLGVENQEAASQLIQNGICVIMNRCIKVEHDRLFR